MSKLFIKNDRYPNNDAVAIVWVYPKKDLLLSPVPGCTTRVLLQNIFAGAHPVSRAYDAIKGAMVDFYGEIQTCFEVKIKHPKDLVYGPNVKHVIFVPQMNIKELTVCGAFTIQRGVHKIKGTHTHNEVVDPNFQTWNLTVNSNLTVEPPFPRIH